MKPKSLTCNSCGIAKKAKDFSYSDKSAGTRHKICKICMKQFKKAKYITKAEIIKASLKKYKKKKKK